MIEHPQRVEQFKGEIADMRLADPAAARDRLLLGLGAALMGIGVVLEPIAYAMSHGTRNALQQRDAHVLALIGLTLAVVGGALFLRYSLAQFLRFWLARLSWEQQAQTDRVVEALAPGSTAVPPAPVAGAAPAPGSTLASAGEVRDG